MLDSQDKRFGQYMAGASNLVAGAVFSVYKDASQNVHPLTQGVLRPAGALQVERGINASFGNYKDIVNAPSWEDRHLPNFCTVCVREQAPFFPRLTVSRWNTLNHKT
mmetsp:Transcript_7716/g.47807  ORF Transcript_7716/g.47807 Transcript_7716/m.47807 type:complete len:107 (-) Transcript_7716:2590-2910(-)